ncbi:phenylalanyl-tRNA synthetase subunit beta [Actinobacillus equuli]|nr:phenylalanyl-tRNA synthetase subunit beta [Actinobacillus equuli]
MLDGKEIGFIGSVHPSIVQKLGIKGKPVVFEILGDAIANRPVPTAKEISKFPANNRDIAVVVDENVPAGDVLAACRNAGGSKLVAVNLFDVYRGANLEAGKKSLAISLTVQDTEKTLEEEEISAVTQAVLAELAQRFQAYLRD